jgi:hypothetical protein
MLARERERERERRRPRGHGRGLRGGGGAAHEAAHHRATLTWGWARRHRAVSRRCPLVATGADMPIARQATTDARWPGALPRACHLRRRQIRPSRWGRSLLPFLRVRVSELNPLLLIVAGLRSRASASAHGIPTPLTRKGETLGGSDTIVRLRGLHIG